MEEGEPKPLKLKNEAYVVAKYDIPEGTVLGLIDYSQVPPVFRWLDAVFEIKHDLNDDCNLKE